jgi:hypothetical protein
VIISSQNQNGNHYYGRGKIELFLKTDSTLVQSFESNDLNFYSNSLKLNSKSKGTFISNYGPVIIKDFNFDGSEDIAINNSNFGPYGAPCFDVYVYNVTRNKFVMSSELTNLFSTNVGFNVDDKQKRIITANKSSYCWNISEEYEVIPKKGLRKVKEVIEDCTEDPKNYIIVTEKNFINGSWKIKKKKFRINDYYKK